MSQSATDKMAEIREQDPEASKKGMEAWHAWAEKLGDSLLNLGSPLGNAQTITESGASPSNKNIVGYSVIQAESMEKALELMQGHPHLGWAEGCEIELNESLPMPS